MTCVRARLRGIAYVSRSYWTGRSLLLLGVEPGGCTVHEEVFPRAGANFSPVGVDRQRCMHSCLALLAKEISRRDMAGGQGKGCEVII